MKKLVCLFVVGIFLSFGFSAVAIGESASKQATPTVETSGPIKMEAKATVTLSGKGFKPGQEVNLLFTAEDGMQSDISYGLKPAPKADDSGAWSTTWAAGDFVDVKMVKTGKAYKITVTDSDYQPLAQTSVEFAK